MTRSRTTQHALLEPFLARRRIASIRRHIRGDRVLDFGCGEHLWCLRALGGIMPGRVGYDLLYDSRPSFEVDGIRVVGRLSELEDGSIDTVTALAVFEHVEPGVLPAVLGELARITGQSGRIVGTVPTPSAEPVLEFLSYRLRLIDESQIRDHKIYYDRETLAERAGAGGWRLSTYGRFQFGLNSWFVLDKERISTNPHR